MRRLQTALLLTLLTAAGPALAQQTASDPSPTPDGSAEAAPVVPAATEDPTERARAQFQQGVADYQAGRYEQALAAFQEAFRLKPHPLVRVNMANCYDKLDRPLEALFHFERFLASDAGSPAQRREVKTSLERVRARIGEVDLRIAPDGATVVIDGGEQRKAPILEPVRLAAGTHAIEVRLEGYQSVDRDLQVKGGAEQTLEITLQPAPQPVADTAPAPEPTPEPTSEPAAPQDATHAQTLAAAEQTFDQPERGGLSTRVWVAGGVSAALLVGAAVTGLAALGAQQDFEDQRSRRYDESLTVLERRAAYDDARDAAQRADALALTSDILLGGALIGGALTTYLYLRDRRDRSTARLTPSLGPGHAGLRLDARF